MNACAQEAQGPEPDGGAGGAAAAADHNQQQQQQQQQQPGALPEPQVGQHQLAPDAVQQLSQTVAELQGLLQQQVTSTAALREQLQRQQAMTAALQEQLREQQATTSTLQQQHQALVAWSNGIAAAAMAVDLKTLAKAPAPVLNQSTKDAQLVAMIVQAGATRDAATQLASGRTLLALAADCQGRWEVVRVLACQGLAKGQESSPFPPLEGVTTPPPERPWSAVEAARACLRVRKGAPLTDITGSYRQLSRRVHPDKLEHVGDNRVLANQAFQYLSAADKRVFKHNDTTFWWYYGPPQPSQPGAWVWYGPYRASDLKAWPQVLTCPVAEARTPYVPGNTVGDMLREYK